MSIGARHELARSVSVRYRSASRLDKGRILNEFCAASGYSRKHALRLVLTPPEAKRARRHRKRASKYTELEEYALGRLWPDSGYLGARRLVAALPELMEALERHGEWVPEAAIREKLAAMSVSTCGRLLKGIRARFKPRGMVTTKPGTLLRKSIAVRTGTEWTDDRPGFFEADLVSHCGESTQGSYLSTLTLTDICTGWTETSALATKTQIEVCQGIDLSLRRVPFDALGIDSDNGSEFINWHLKAYCDNNGLLFTRCRPYRKNDQAHVEQKNYSVVRRHAGYSRFEGDEHLKALRVVLGIVRLLVNYFEPSMKIVSKERVGGRVKKKYDTPKTPYQRVLDSVHVDQERKDEITKTYLQLNPAALRRRLKLAKRPLMGQDLISLMEDQIEEP
jgi:hypothetical protein